MSPCSSNDLYAKWYASVLAEKDKQRESNLERPRPSSSPAIVQNLTKRSRMARRNSFVIKKDAARPLGLFHSKSLELIVGQSRRKRMRSGEPESLQRQVTSEDKNGSEIPARHFVHNDDVSITKTPVKAAKILCLPTSETCWKLAMALPRSSSFTSSIVPSAAHGDHDTKKTVTVLNGNNTTNG